MRLRGMVSVLLVGALVSMFAVGAALAAQEEESSKDKSVGKGSANAKNGGLALELEGRPTAVNGYVDLGQQGLTPGDLFIFSDELYKSAQADGQDSSEKIGQADGRCTLIDPASERLMCTVISSFENGTVVTEGVTNDGNSPSTSSVTGGTGEYRGVTGEATLDLTSAEGPHDIRLDLQRNESASQPDREETGQEKEDSQEKTEAKADDPGSQKNANRDSAGKAKGKTREQ